VATVDTKELMEKAARSEEKESFQTVARGPGLRLGAGARAPRNYFVEVLVELFPDGQVDLDQVEKVLGQLRWLEARDYRLSCRDDRAVCGERAVSEEEMENEVAAVRLYTGAALEKDYSRERSRDSS
jgi:hypothetical protein